MAGTYVITGQYGAARRSADLAIALRPDVTNNYYTKSLTYAREGDSTSARATIHQVISRLGAAAVIDGGESVWAYLLPHFLDSADRVSVRSLKPPSDTTGREIYYFLTAELNRLDGRGSRALVLYDSAAQLLQIAASREHFPFSEAVWRALLGLANARLGRKTAAIAEAHRAMDVVPARPNAWNGSDWIITAADVHMIVGDKEGALKLLEEGWSIRGVPEQYIWKVRWDPLYAPLRGNPRFERLSAWKPTSRR